MNRLMPLMLALPLAGCASFSTTSFKSAGKVGKPTQMIVRLDAAPIETQGVLTHQGAMCRIYFMAGSNPYPVRTDGEVTLYAFDRTDDQTDDRPIGRYTIAASNLHKHLRKMPAYYWKTR